MAGERVRLQVRERDRRGSAEARRLRREGLIPGVLYGNGKQPIQASLTVQLVGEPEGVKEGGVLSQVQREINVEALPREIPEHIELDVSGMKIGDTLRLADLIARDGVTYLD